MKTVSVAVELVEALEDLQEDLLRQVLRGVMPPGELVGDVEDLALESRDDLLPRGLVAVQAAVDDPAVERLWSSGLHERCYFNSGRPAAVQAVNQ